MKEAVIVSAVRTPVGKFQGSLQSFSAPQLGALVVREACAERLRTAAARPSRTPSAVSEFRRVHHGLRACRPASARTQRARPPSTRVCRRKSGALTINQVCGSGLRAVALAAQGIQTGRRRNRRRRRHGVHDQRALSSAPGPLAAIAWATAHSIDSMIHDGLWDVYNDFHMGAAAEMVAEKYGITREEQDAFAAESHRRAAAATAQGVFRDEILPVEIPPAKKAQQPSHLRCRRIHPPRHHRRNSLADSSRHSKKAAPSPRAMPRA